MPGLVDKRLKFVGLGNPADYPEVPFRHDEGRPFPADLYRGLAGPPQLTFGPDGRANTGVWRFRIDVQNNKRAVANFVGYAASGGAGNLRRTLPVRDPDFYGMVCVGASTEYANPSGYSPLTGRIDGHFEVITEFDPRDATGESEQMYRYSILTLTFAHVPYRIVNDADTGASILGERSRYCTFIQTASNEYVSLDRAIIFWNDAACPAYQAGDATGPNHPVQVATGGGLVRAVSEIVLTWHRVPQDAIPSLLLKWRALLGTVNDNDYLLPQFNATVIYPKETLLFQPWRTHERMGPLGYPEYDVELRWLYRNNGDVATPKGWNHFLYPPDGNYYRVSWGSGIAPVKPIYALADHTTVFQP
jgi:hypothetical protein